jgi:lipopolysaccharide export system protein LptC
MIKKPRLTALVRRKIRPRRRKSVSALRIILPTLAVSVCVAIAAQAAIRAAESKASAAAAAGVPLRMENPRFTGAMKDGREFLITATSALRDKTDTNKVALVAPKLTRGYGSDNPTQVVSQQGVYDESTSALLLTGNVQINNGAGYAFSTEKAVIDTRTGQVMGDAGVQGSGTQGNKVQADSYSVTDKGDRVTFKGRVRTRINPGQ